jgi:RNA polymerase sigma-70 factor (ECF subfamily)
VTAAAATVTAVETAAESPAPLRPVESLDPESRRWLDELRRPETARQDTVERLHALLLRAAHFEVARRRPGLPHLRGNELEEIALEAAHDALMSVLRRLDDFRGDSRFTTWAYKFALYEAAVKLRRREWQGRELPLEPEDWTLFSATGPTPEREAELRELVGEVKHGMGALTPHQRTVLVAVALNGVPIDVLAERLDTTRGALYKTLHDARTKLRRHLAGRGLAIDPTTEEGT